MISACFWLDETMPRILGRRAGTSETYQQAEVVHLKTHARLAEALLHAYVKGFVYIIYIFGSSNKNSSMKRGIRKVWVHHAQLFYLGQFNLHASISILKTRLFDR